MRAPCGWLQRKQLRRIRQFRPRLQEKSGELAGFPAHVPGRVSRRLPQTAKLAASALVMERGAAGCRNLLLARSELGLSIRVHLQRGLWGNNRSHAVLLVQFPGITRLGAVVQAIKRNTPQVRWRKPYSTLSADRGGYVICQTTSCYRVRPARTKSAEARRLLAENPGLTIAADFQSLYVAITLAQRDPSGRYPLRDERLLPIVEYLRRAVFSAAQDRGISVIATNSDGNRGKTSLPG